MNTETYYPGTKVLATDNKSLLTGIFSATKGMTLSQICDLTGIEPTTIQNWVKRGYVNSPLQRKYSKSQVARIIIINMLRDTMQIEKIAKLLSYINGNLLDKSDDIMDDSDIYEYLCNIIIPADLAEVVDIRELFRKTDEKLKEYSGPSPDAPGRLRLALQAIICAYESANLKRYADRLTKGI